jgi:DNA-binding NtrC family response regulator
MKKKSILIVEDDRAILESFKRTFHSKGYSVEATETGQDAIKKSKTRSFDLALLDIKLPDMEGTKLLTKLHEAVPKMVKIMITGYPTLENAEALNLGADAYIIKPIKPEKLLEIIKEKLREREEAGEKYEGRRILKSWKK